MSFKNICPECGQHIELEDAWNGQQGNCPTCGTAILFQAQPAVAPTPEPEPAYEPPPSAAPAASAATHTAFRNSFREKGRDAAGDLFQRIQENRNESIPLNNLRGLPPAQRRKVFARNRKYFYSGAGKYLAVFIMILIGAPFFGIIAGAITGSSAVGGGAGVLAAAGIIFLSYLTRAATGSEIDALADSELKIGRHRALEMFGVEEEEIAFAPMFGYRHWDFLREDHRSLSDLVVCAVPDAMDRSGQLRSPVVEVHFFAFSEEILHHYYRFASLVSNSIREGSDEYFYRDIENIVIERSEHPRRLPMWGGKTMREDQDRMLSYAGFELWSGNGNRISCNLPERSEIRQAIQAMRTLIRQKKQQLG